MKVPIEVLALRVWALAAGVALWMPALMVPVAGLPFQPLDLIVPAGWPLIAAHVLRLPAGLMAVLLATLLSLGLSWLVSGGEAIVLAWTLAFAVPFVLLVGLAVAEKGACRGFLRGFLAGAGGSLALFALQLLVGAEALDFRNNHAFRLPPQYGRGFALMPEVSTFAVHGIIALAALVPFALAGAQGAVRHAVRHMARLLALVLVIGLLFTRSTSLLVLMPPLTALALAKTTRASFNALLLTAIVMSGVGLLVVLFMQSFYVERLESASAERSAAMRLASLIDGLSVLWGEEIFGVGVGRNDLVAHRAFEVARMLGLSFGALPEGVNAQLVGRIFEEGWPATLGFAVAGLMLMSALRRAREPEDVALALVAAGSLMSAAIVVGYRGIYTNWLWLAIPAGLLARWQAARRRAASMKAGEAASIEENLGALLAPGWRCPPCNGMRGGHDGAPTVG
jgi:hypothetical protein